MKPCKAWISARSRLCISKPFSNHQEGSGVDLDYIAIELCSETLDFSLLTLDLLQISLIEPPATIQSCTKQQIKLQRSP